MGFAALQVALGPARLGLGWDETVYVSQVSTVPAAAFTAPRARGVSLLVAPIASWTTSTAALRTYLVLLSALGLFLAFRVWVRLVGRASVALAAGLFASLWVSLVYGNEAMPNFWLALAMVAAAGFTMRAARDARPRDYLGAALTVIGAMLLRPSDAAWFTLALVLAVIHARRRRVLLVAVLAAALVIGFLPWAVEAYARFGGVLSRLHAASVNEGGLSPQPGFVYEARALYGPLLCRPCGQAQHPLALDAWWFALPLLVTIAVVTARRRPQFWPMLLAAVAAAAVAMPYLTLVGYAAPRFLLPAYALASLPVAGGAIRLARRRPGRCPHRWQWAVTGAVVIFAAAQLSVAYLQYPAQRPSRVDYARIADRLHRLGILPPCYLRGTDAPPIAYYAGCASTAFPAAGPTMRADVRTGRCRPAEAVIITSHDQRPGYTRHWRAYRLHGLISRTPWTVYLPDACAPVGAPKR